jgi:zinc protease
MTREVKLANGLSVVLIEDHRVPMVTLEVGIQTRTRIAPDLRLLTQQFTLSEATADLLTQGAGGRTAEQIASEVERLGARLSSAAGDDYAEVSASVISENVDAMIDILADVLVRPAFPAKEVTLHKENRLQNLSVQRQDPTFLVGEQFRRIVYGAHPYAVSAPTPRSVASLTRAGISEFYRSRFTPEGSVLVIAGDFDSGKVEAKVRESLAAWRATTDSAAGLGTPKFPRQNERRVFLVNRPGSDQAVFRVGGLALARSDPEYFPLLVASTILGGGTASRLFLNIREDKGYAYDVSCTVDGEREKGAFFCGFEVRNEVVGPALKELLAEMARMSRERVSVEELLNAKNYLGGLFSLSLSTQGGVAERIVRSRMLGLGEKYLESYRVRLESVTAEQVQEAARKYVGVDRAIIVVAGDASKVKKQLTGIGPISLLNERAKPR